MFILTKKISLTCVNDYESFKKELNNMLSTQNTSTNREYSDFFQISLYINEIELESKSPDKRFLIPKANITSGKNKNEIEIEISYGITSFFVFFFGIAFLLLLMVFNNNYKFKYYELFFIITLSLSIFLLRRNLSYCSNQLRCLNQIFSSMKEVKLINIISMWKIKLHKFDGKYL